MHSEGGIKTMKLPVALHYSGIFCSAFLESYIHVRPWSARVQCHHRLGSVAEEVGMETVVYWQRPAALVQVHKSHAYCET